LGIDDVVGPRAAVETEEGAGVGALGAEPSPGLEGPRFVGETMGGNRKGLRAGNRATCRTCPRRVAVGGDDDRKRIVLAVAAHEDEGVGEEADEIFLRLEIGVAKPSASVWPLAPTRMRVPRTSAPSVTMGRVAPVIFLR